MNNQPTPENFSGEKVLSPQKQIEKALLSTIRMAAMEISATQIEHVNDNGKIRVPTSGHDCSVAYAQQWADVTEKMLHNLRSN